MSDQDRLAIQQAKGPSWKKILVWCGVVLLFCTGIAILMIVVLRKQNPVAASKAVVDYAKQQSAKADVTAKIETAKARAVEDAVVDELERLARSRQKAELCRLLARITDGELEER